MLEWDAVLSQSTSAGDALFAPAVVRNKQAILGVLRRVLPPVGLVLEVASGSGEHVVHFAAALPDLQWQPSDAEAKALRSIAAHAKAAGLPKILPPLPLDVHAEPWPVTRADALLAINMVHVAPWSATEALVAGARRCSRTCSRLSRSRCRSGSASRMARTAFRSATSRPCHQSTTRCCLAPDATGRSEYPIPARQSAPRFSPDLRATSRPTGRRLLGSRALPWRAV